MNFEIMFFIILYLNDLIVLAFLRKLQRASHHVWKQDSSHGNRNQQKIKHLDLNPLSKRLQKKPYCEPNADPKETIFNEKRDSDTRLTFYLPSFTELR